MLRTNSLNVIDVCQILNELQFDRMNIWIYNCRSYRLNSHNRYDSCHTTIYLFTFLFMTNHLHKYIMCWCSLVWIIVVVIVVIVTCLRSIAYFFFFCFFFYTWRILSNSISHSNSIGDIIGQILQRLSLRDLAHLFSLMILWCINKRGTIKDNFSFNSNLFANGSIVTTIEKL